MPDLLANDPQKKRAFMQSEGLNPDQYDLQYIEGQGYRVVPLTKQQPVIAAGGGNNIPTPTAPSISEEPQSSSWGAGIRGALSGIVPTVGSLAGAVPGAKVGAALGTMVTPGLGTAIGSLVGGIGGALGGGYLASEAQEAVLPDSINEQLALDVQQHPDASTGGRLVSSLVALRPDLQAVKGAAQALSIGSRNAVAPRILAMEQAPANVNNLMNVGTGAIVGGAMPVVQALANEQEGQPIDWKQVAILSAMEAAGGAVINNPRRWAQKTFRLQPNEYVERGSAVPINSSLREAAQPNYVEPPAPPSIEELYTLKPAPVANDPLSVINRIISTPGVMIKGSKKQPEKFVPYKSAEESAKFIEEGGETIPRQAAYEESTSPVSLSDYQKQSLIRQKDYERALAEEAEQNLSAQRKAKSELDRQEAAALASENAARALDLQQTLSKSAIKSPTAKTIVKPLATTETGQEIIPDYTGVQEHDIKVNAEESAADLEARRLEGHMGDKYQPKEEVKGKPSVPQWIVDWSEKQAIKQGVDKPVIKNERLYTPDGSMEINGRAWMEGTARKVTANLDRVDTLPHEMTHHFLDQLRKSPRKQDNALADTLLKKVEGLESFKAYNKARRVKDQKPVDAEEYLMQKTGEITVEDLKKEPSWWKTFSAAIRTAYSSKARIEDLAQTLSQSHRFAPSAESGKMAPIKPSTSKVSEVAMAPKSQPNEEQPASADKQRYDEIWREIESKQLDMDSPEFEALWRESEAIKNRNGGMPPRNQEADSAGKKKETPEEIAERIKQSKLISFKDQMDADIEQKVEQKKELFKQSGLKLGDVLYSPKGTAMEIFQEGISIYRDKRNTSGKDGEPLVWVKYKDANGDEVQGTAFLNMLSHDDPFEGGRYQQVNQESVTEPITNPVSKLGRLLTPVLENIERKGPIGKKVANGIREALDVSEEGKGAFDNIYRKSLSRLNSKEKQELRDILYDEDVRHVATNVDALLPNVRAAYMDIRRAYNMAATKQKGAGQPVFDYNTGTYRERGINPLYFSHIPSVEVMQELTTKGAKFDTLKKEYLDYATSKELHGNKAYSPEKALEAFNGMLEQWTAGNTSSKPSFGATRLAEGLGLPKSWLEKDLGRLLDRYSTRFFKDRAWHDVIEKDNELSLLLGSKEDAWGRQREKIEGVESLRGDEDVENALQQILGNNKPKSPNQDAIAKVVNSVIMGPLTTLGNTISTTVGMSKYYRPGQQLDNLSSIKNFSKALNNSFETGLNKAHLISTEELLQPANLFAENATKLANTINRWTGREWGEQMNRAIGQAQAETIIALKANEAQMGDSGANEFLTRLANERDWTRLSREQLASRLAKRVEGTYDIRGLPQWIIDSGVAPYFKLSRWSIQTLNNFREDVIGQAKKGNYTPLITSLFGSAVGGMILQELRENITGKQANVASFKEIEEAKNDKVKWDQMTYKLASAAAYAGFAGIGSDLLRATLDKWHGNKPQTISVPMMEVGFDLADKILDAAQAIREGEDVAGVAIKFHEELLKNHVQVARIMMDNVARVEGKDSERGRDFIATQDRNSLRKWKMLQDMPYQDRTAMPEQANPFVGRKEKSFKKEANMEEAGKKLEGILTHYLDRYGDQPDVLKDKLRSLKQNSFQTMPNLERDVARFGQYYLYLKETKGQKEADRIVKDYVQQNMINRAKTQMVPTL